MQYLIRRVETQKFLTHLFEDKASLMFRSDNLHDCYRYTDPIIAKDVARNLWAEHGERFEIVGVELDIRTGDTRIVGEGLFVES